MPQGEIQPSARRNNEHIYPQNGEFDERLRNG